MGTIFDSRLRVSFLAHYLRHLFLLSALLFFAISATAITDNKPTEPIVVKTGIYLLDASKFDLATGSYNMDFYLMLNCKPNCKNVDIEVMNGEVLSIEQQENKETAKFYRIKASLNEDMNLHNFPFDRQNLTIILEDKHLDKNKLIFQPDFTKTHLDQRLVIVGWAKPSGTAKVENYYYPPLNQTFSRYIFKVQIERPFLSGIIKCLLPAIFILITGFLTLTMEPGKVVQRLSVGTTALIAMVVLHLGFTSSIPSLGYMTYIDAFMLINYFGLMDVLIQTVILMRLVDLHKTKIAHRLYVIFRYATPGLWLVLQIINFLIFYH